MNSKLKILIVDDERLMQDMMGNILKEQGFTGFEKCGSPELALKLHAKKKFDLTFLDIEMPEKNGIEVLRELKQEYPDRHVVMLSGSTAIHTVKKALSCGADSFIAKPYTPKKVLTVIEKLMSQASE